jgi:predicted MFS family arabinose efflux permease
VSGFGAGIFGAVQSAMVMSMVPDELRGRALGLMTLAIGAAPFGCVVLGEIAERIGASVALRGFAWAGVAMQLLWLSPVARPGALWIRRPT